MRQYNVFSPLVVISQGEQFQWTVTTAELKTAPKQQIVVEPLPGGSWALDQPSYTLTASSPTATAKVTGNLGTGFICQPGANNVGSQKIIITPNAANAPCDGASVAPGNYFIWTNDSADTQIIRPDPANPNYWPLPQPHYAVPPKSWIAVQVPSDAANGSYPFTVSDRLGAPQCPQQGQPIIIVGSNVAAKPKH
jgi:hypothetical protein